MSRSVRKTPIRGFCANSEKGDKQKSNKCLRRKCKQLLKDEDSVLPIRKEVSDIWAMAKDGKTKIDKNSKWMRK